MTATTVGAVQVEVSPDAEVLRDSPMRSERDEEGLVQYGRLSTPDGFLGTAGVVTWAGGDVEVRLLDFVQGPDPYRRLERAGHMGVTTSGGRWIALLRALRHRGRAWPTLADVSWPELDHLAGARADELLTRVPGSRVGTWQELNPNAKRYLQTPAVSCAEDDAVTLLTAYALTRVLPIMKNFGLSVPQPFLS